MLLFSPFPLPIPTLFRCHPSAPLLRHRFGFGVIPIIRMILLLLLLHRSLCCFSSVAHNPQERQQQGGTPLFFPFLFFFFFNFSSAVFFLHFDVCMHASHQGLDYTQREIAGKSQIIKTRKKNKW